MKGISSALCSSTFLLLSNVVSAASIAEINGINYNSPYRNKDVRDVAGLITAKGPDGFWMRSLQPDDDDRTSESIYVYGNATVSGNTTIGDSITLNGRVAEYRSSDAYIYLTQITRPSSIKIVSHSNEVSPKVIGKDTSSPPTELFSSLDDGDVFSLPGNQSRISQSNPELEPTKYGLDFWESLMGELVTVEAPVVLNRPNNYGDTWVAGNWQKTNQNARRGLTITSGANANPESIIIGTPLDGSRNPNNTKLGDTLKDITGVVYQAFGTYRILPLTALVASGEAEPTLPEPVTFESDGSCKQVTVGDYNIENFSSNSSNIEGRAEHIVKYLNGPDIVFLQEIQDDDGPTNNGVVSANKTLNTLVAAISSISPLNYSFIDIVPINDQDGGQPGGNIRVAYLYNADVVQLVDAKPGSSTDATEILSGPSLSFNPGRIEPSNSAWRDSRKPLAAQWRIISDNSTFFTVNVHFTSKGGSSGIEVDPRPPINGGVDQRTAQANVTAAFVAEILAEDSNAAVIVAGDFNEFAYVEPLKLFVQESGLVDLDEAAGIDPVERYTYLFDMSCQQLDHFFISPKVASQQPKLEHVHVNTWVTSDKEISDHDPSVAQFNVCQ